VIARREGGRRGSYQLLHLEAKLWRWSHDGAQQRWSAVLRWEDGYGYEEERLEEGVGAVDNEDVVVVSFIGS
jgi:hypothetical protein